MSPKNANDQDRLSCGRTGDVLLPHDRICIRGYWQPERHVRIKEIEASRSIPEKTPLQKDNGDVHEQQAARHHVWCPTFPALTLHPVVCNGFSSPTANLPRSQIGFPEKQDFQFELVQDSGVDAPWPMPPMAICAGPGGGGKEEGVGSQEPGAVGLDRSPCCRRNGPTDQRASVGPS